MTDIRQMREWGEWLKSQGWYVDKVHSIGGKEYPAYIRKIPLTPISVIKIQRFEEELREEEIKDIKRKYRGIYVSLEPTKEEVANRLVNKGYRYEKVPFLPAKTLVIDLTKTEGNLWKDLATNTKRILNRKNEIEVKKMTADKFYEGWKKWSPTMILFRGQFEKVVKAFGKKVEFWGSFYKDINLSAIMMIYSKDGAHYFHTWTSKKGRELNSHFYLVWDRIKDAKKRRRRFFDFEGIYDERFPIKKWLGFSEFKKKFGGEIITYPGCLVRWF